MLTLLGLWHLYAILVIMVGEKSGGLYTNFRKNKKETHIFTKNIR